MRRLSPGKAGWLPFRDSAQFNFWRWALASESMRGLWETSLACEPVTDLAIVQTDWSGGSAHREQAQMGWGLAPQRIRAGLAERLGIVPPNRRVGAVRQANAASAVAFGLMHKQVVTRLAAE